MRSSRGGESRPPRAGLRMAEIRAAGRPRPSTEAGSAQEPRGRARRGGGREIVRSGDLETEDWARPALIPASAASAADAGTHPRHRLVSCWR